jgi:transposase
LAYFLSDTVDALDLKVFYKPYEGDGRRNSPYDPRMMVKLLLYGYATGIFSSRKIAKKLEEDVAFRVLAGRTFRRTGRSRSFASATCRRSKSCLFRCSWWPERQDCSRWERWRWMVRR